MNKTSFLTLLPVIILLILPGQAQPVNVPETGFAHAPVSALSGTEFTLQLLTYGFNCAHEYLQKTISITGNTIHLSFVPLPHPEALCPAIYAPYGPEFTIPPLDPGRYIISATVQDECMAADPPQPLCELSGPSYEGTLIITEAGGWYAGEETAPADTAFDLQILNLEHGNCYYSYDHLAPDVSGNEITLSFLTVHTPDNICFANIIPWGPVFSLEALSAGNYDVYIVQRQACEFEEPVCPVRLMRRYIGGLAVGNQISGTQALPPGSLPTNRSFTLSLKPDRLFILNPNGMDIQSITFFGLNGRKVISTPIHESGAVISAALGTILKPGIYFSEARIQGRDQPAGRHILTP